tara:strand:+ start:23163 stop:23615 length:453 start_codon:yes stop_codon:yes gene_type:complete
MERRRMVRVVRKIGNRNHVLSDHSLMKVDANRIAVRHRKLGMNARVIKHADGKYAVYRSCSLRKNPAVKPGKRKIIHVNQAMIAHNRKNPGKPKPPITIQTSNGSIRASRMKIKGDSELVYDPQNQLSCGARLWIETKSPIELDDCARLE